MPDTVSSVPQPPATPAIVGGLRDLADRYDGLILDLWGVLHDGVAPFPGAVDCLRHLSEAGKRIVLLSNAPRRADAVIERMTEIGIPPGLYHHVMSSGEDAWRHLQHPDGDPFYEALGPRCYQIRSPRETGMLDGSRFVPADRVEEADFILNTGPWAWEATVADYADVLNAARARDLPMICANPDLVVMHGGRTVMCAGALAQHYEEVLGGRVRWHGKPHPPIYETCFDLLGVADRRRILAVGDSLRTDITGANRVGIDGLLVAGGIHREEFGVAEGAIPDRDRLAAAIAQQHARPVAVVPHFVW
ncbi:MAG TPA: TIGR01459 family HAD-type hydrolase [Stellaceae bacterium]